MQGPKSVKLVQLVHIYKQKRGKNVIEVSFEPRM